MTALGAQQERQLLLIERMSGKMDAICDSQKRLQDANASLRQENERLRDELQKKEKQGNRRGLRNSRRSSTVEIPNELRVSRSFCFRGATSEYPSTHLHVSGAFEERGLSQWTLLLFISM